MSSRLNGAISAGLLFAGATVGPAQADQLLLNVKAPPEEAAPRSAPSPGINLGGGFIEFLLTGRVGPAPRAEAVAPVNAVAPDAPTPPASPTEGDLVAIVDYDGPFKPGAVILNVTRRQVYHVLPGGKMAIYTDEETQAKLAQALLKMAGRQPVREDRRGSRAGRAEPGGVPGVRPSSPATRPGRLAEESGA